MMKYNAVVASVPYDALHMSCSGFLTCIPCTNEVDCDAFCSSAYLCLKHNTTTHHMVSALQLTVFWNCILDPCYWQCNRGTVFMDQLYCQCGTVFLAVFSGSCILGSVFWELYSWQCFLGAVFLDLTNGWRGGGAALMLQLPLFPPPFSHLWPQH